MWQGAPLSVSGKGGTVLVNTGPDTTAAAMTQSDCKKHNLGNADATA
jgi:hypothetical protein